MNDFPIAISVRQPSIEEAMVRMRFKGYYTVVGLRAKISSDGQPYSIIDISDSTGTLSLYCFIPEFFGLLNALNPVVQIEACQKIYNGKKYFRCQYIEMSDHSELALRVGVQGLPNKLCPYPSLVTELSQLVESIENSSIRRFVDTSIVQEGIFDRYLNVPGSINHHHNYRAGLLLHSLEVAEIILEYPYSNAFEKDLAIASALIHDIGKTLTYTIDSNRTALGYLVDHDSLTLEICANALKRLEQELPKAAIQLRHIFTCASPNARYGFKANLNVAKRLQEADKISAEGIDTRPLGNG